ncbi:hypothetical protein BsWGS_12441 [Bradybaena similaris]
MPVKDITLQSESGSIQARHEIDSAHKLPPSLKNYQTEQLTDVTSDDEDYHAAQRLSRASSLCDDSGFNSSSSEDRDDLIDMSLRQKCDSDWVKSLDAQGHNTPDSLLKGHTCGFEESDNSDILRHIAKDSPVELKISNTTTSQEQSNSITSNQCRGGSDISDNSSANSNTSIRNTGRISNRRQRADNRNAQAAAGAPVTPRTPRSRRHRPRDLNNNDSAHKDLNSYLSTPPFKLQDCFQNQGLLSLVACITYTVALMIIFCILGVICDYIKSLIGKQNLRDLRADIVHSRHTRTNMASG